MLTAVPRYVHTEDERALLEVARRAQRFQFTWDGFLLGWCAAFHLALAAVLALAPWDQLYTAGTAPVLDLATRFVWAVLFAAVGVAVTLQPRVRRPALRLLTWVAVLFLGGVWLTAFAVAIWRGQGSWPGVVAWLFLYGPMGVVAFRLGLRKR